MFSSPANEKLLTEDALSAAHRADIRWLGVSPWAHGAFQSSRNGLTCSDHRSGLRTRLPAGRSRSCERTSSGSAPRARIYCLQAARGRHTSREAQVRPHAMSPGQWDTRDLRWSMRSTRTLSHRGWRESRSAMLAVCLTQSRSFECLRAAPRPTLDNR